MNDLLGAVKATAIAGVVITLFVLVTIALRENTTCRTNWMSCSDNRDMADNYKGWFNAQESCRREVSKKATFGSLKLKWPPFSFATSPPGDSNRSGVATLIEYNALAENSSGVWGNTIVTCRYGLVTNEVVELVIE